MAQDVSSPISRRSFLQTGSVIAGLAIGQAPFFASENIEPVVGQLDSYNLRLSPDPAESFNLENDVVGVRLWGRPNRPTLNIGKSDIWDRRWFDDRQPLITLEKIRELASSGRIAEVAPSLHESVYDVYSKFERLPPPQSFQQDQCWGIRQHFLPEPTFPKGFQFSLLSSSLGAVPEIVRNENEQYLGTPMQANQVASGICDFRRDAPINEALGAAATARFERVEDSFAIITSIETSQDNGGTIRDAIASLNSAKALGLNGLVKEQLEAVRQGKKTDVATATFFGRTVKSGPKYVMPTLRKRGGYYGDIHFCSVSPTKFVFQYSSPWHGDFHFNEVVSEDFFTMGRFEEVLPYCDMILTMLPGAMQNAKDVYHLPGQCIHWLIFRSAVPELCIQI